MSIAASLNTLRGVRDAIRDAIVSKGGSLPVGSPMGSYAQAITSLPSGSGGGDTEIPFRSRLTVPGDTDPWHLTSLTATKVGAYAFYGDMLLTTADFPAVTSIGNYAFYGDRLLTTADFPLVTSIGTNAFQNCTSLTTADFPVATSIGTNVFQGCTSLTSVSLPVATSIGSGAFQNCTSLTTADFPVVASIGNYAFYGCASLTSLTLSNTTIATLSNTNALQNTPIAQGTGHIYVPDHLVDQYKTATNWATYANQIRPISQKP